VLGKGVARALEALIIVGFLRGPSVRDVAAALAEAFDESIVGTSTVAMVCQDTRERYRACTRCPTSPPSTPSASTRGQGALLGRARRRPARRATPRPACSR